MIFKYFTKLTAQHETFCHPPTIEYTMYKNRKELDLNYLNKNKWKYMFFKTLF